eukprot:gb/GEZN01003482.1/.p1 GENE.gb/GEZN01003482.1/~~gb/GEZN01003482.1/.p1  ORF type:complete len:693 (+),score=81.70 gb/GEZN01003482.1/:85-2163(+)
MKEEHIRFISNKIYFVLLLTDLGLLVAVVVGLWRQKQRLSAIQDAFIGLLIADFAMVLQMLPVELYAIIYDQYIGGLWCQFSGFALLVYCLAEFSSVLLASFIARGTMSTSPFFHHSESRRFVIRWLVVTWTLSIATGVFYFLEGWLGLYKGLYCCLPSYAHFWASIPFCLAWLICFVGIIINFRYIDQKLTQLSGLFDNTHTSPSEYSAARVAGLDLRPSASTNSLVYSSARAPPPSRSELSSGVAISGLSPTNKRDSAPNLVALREFVRRLGMVYMLSWLPVTVCAVMEMVGLSPPYLLDAMSVGTLKLQPSLNCLLALTVHAKHDPRKRTISLLAPISSVFVSLSMTPWAESASSRNGTLANRGNLNEPLLGLAHYQRQESQSTQQMITQNDSREEIVPTNIVSSKSQEKSSEKTPQSTSWSVLLPARVPAFSQGSSPLAHDAALAMTALSNLPIYAQREQSMQRQHMLLEVVLRGSAGIGDRTAQFCLLNTSVMTLMEAISSTFPDAAGHRFAISYIDDEGDAINIATDRELEHANDIALGQGKLLVLTLTPVHLEQEFEADPEEIEENSNIAKYYSDSASAQEQDMGVRNSHSTSKYASTTDSINASRGSHPSQWNGMSRSRSYASQHQPALQQEQERAGETVGVGPEAKHHAEQQQQQQQQRVQEQEQYDQGRIVTWQQTYDANPR